MLKTIKKSLHSASWTFIQTVSVNVLQFIQAIILLKYLNPSDFGEIGIMNIIFNISLILTTSGFGTVLITSSKKTISFANKLFTFNFFISLIISIVLYLSTFLIDETKEYNFYNNYIIYYIIIILINSFFIIPNAYLIKNFQHKKIAFSYITANSLSVISAIIFAMNDYKVYAIIYSLIIQTLINTIIHLCYIPFKLRINFNYSKDRFDIKRGWYLMSSQLVNSISNSINTYFISRQYSISSLGVYNRAEKFSIIPPSIFKSIISNVLISSFSNSKNTSQFNLKSNQILKIIYNIYTPIILGLFLFSEYIVLNFFSNWIEAIIYFKILLIGVVLLPLNSFTITLIKAKKEGKYFVRNEFYKLISVIIIIFIIVKLGFSLLFFSYVFILKNLIETSINTYKYLEITDQRLLNFLKNFRTSFLLLLLTILINNFSLNFKIVFYIFSIVVFIYNINNNVKTLK